MSLRILSTARIAAPLPQSLLHSASVICHKSHTTGSFLSPALPAKWKARSPRALKVIEFHHPWRSAPPRPSPIIWWSRFLPGGASHPAQLGCFPEPMSWVNAKVTSACRVRTKLGSAPPTATFPSTCSRSGGSTWESRARFPGSCQFYGGRSHEIPPQTRVSRSSLILESSLANPPGGRISPWADHPRSQWVSRGLWPKSTPPSTPQPASQFLPERNGLTAALPGVVGSANGRRRYPPGQRQFGRTAPPTSNLLMPEEAK